MTENTLSRQRIYQLRRIAEGLCGYCGRRPLASGERCKVCTAKNRKKNRKRYVPVKKRKVA